MLKKNLIAIAIVTMGLVMTVSTFGQERGKRPDKKNPDINRSDAQIKPMYVANQEEYMAGGIADVRGGPRDNARDSNSRRKQNPKPNAGFFDTYEQGTNISDDSTVRPAANGIAGATEVAAKDIRKQQRNAPSGQATGKRQHKPIQRQNLGDTGTHEVGYKKRRRGNN